jgi:hypothetical protein
MPSSGKIQAFSTLPSLLDLARPTYADWIGVRLALAGCFQKILWLVKIL